MGKSPIVARINSLLAAKGISKQDFYAQCGITSATLSQWNTGKTRPRIKTLQSIAEFLDTSVDYLMTGFHVSEQGQEQQGIKKDPTQTGEVGKVELLRSLEETDDTKTLLDALDIINRKLQERK